MRRIALVVARVVVYTVAALLIVVGLAITALETGWGKNQIRRLIVRQANQYLTATLEIGRLEGSLLRGIQLGDIRVSREGETIISIDDVSLSYSVRELFEPGLTIRRIQLARPRVFAARQPDGRWNLAALIRREVRQNERTGPGRPIHILSIEVREGDVILSDPLTFGSVHVPARFNKLDAKLSFDYEPVNWHINFDQASWLGGSSSLTVERLAGGLGNGPGGWSFDNLAVHTRESAFTLNGHVQRAPGQPATLDLDVNATRFTFQEWSSVLSPLGNIAIRSAFSTHLKGPLGKLGTDLKLQSDGGAIEGGLVLDTTVPGWHGAGTVTVDRLNLARWLNKPDRPSDISGRVDFNLDLDLGRHFPKGTYAFEGRHAAFMGYEADNVRVRGTLTPTDALISEASGIAYRSNFHIAAGSLGIDTPYRFRFQGTDSSLDLRLVPPSVPVPHVDSVLALDYDVTGQFATPAYLKGDARFHDSDFLGAVIGAGAVGSIDTSADPVRYTGEGDVSRLDLHRFGVGLDVGWMRDPRYAGTVAGRFHVAGAGSDPRSMAVSGGGHLARADLFEGRLFDADVTIDIANGSLTGSYDGHLLTINPAIPFADPQFTASLTGSGRARFAVRDMLLRTTALADYSVDGTMEAQDSVVRGIALDRGSAVFTLTGPTLDLADLRLSGPSLEGRGSGRIEFDVERSSQFDYDVARADLLLIKDLTGQEMSGQIITVGHLTGPLSALHLIGDATVSDLDVSGVKALTTTGQYDVTFPWDAPARGIARVTGRSSFVEVAGRRLLDAAGSVNYADERLEVDLKLSGSDTPPDTPLTLLSVPTVAIAGSMILHLDRSSLDLSRLALTFGGSEWRLDSAGSPPAVSWTGGQISAEPLTFVSGVSGEQRIVVSGTWREDGKGALHLIANHVFLDTFVGSGTAPAPYGGIIDIDATMRGTMEQLIVTGQIAVTEGRVHRLSYEKLAGKVDYANGLFQIDMRLDQAPGVWLTAAGTVPLSLFDTTQPERPMNLTIASSAVSLGLVEGVTSIVHDVTGEIQLNLTATGTSRDPRFSGSVEMAHSGFVVTSTGARYKNGSATFELATERITVSALHLEDREGDTLTVGGSLSTHELTVGELEIDIAARHFEVLNNETGSVDVDAALRLRGEFKAPRVEGDVTILSGQLHIDEILAQALFKPYAIQAAAGPSTSELDGVAVLNPWDRLHLDIAVHSRGTLRMEGQNVQVAQSEPLGLGSFNLRATGDLYLYKDPGQPLYVNGSFDSITGSYAFQGRRFEIDPTSSINFKSDLNPELYVTVVRMISGVEVRVTIAGSLDTPELRLASTPPLESSDILSLIVFNASTNELSAAQQQDLAVRAGALAYGFVATPLVTALQRSLGLDTLEIEPNVANSGPRVTIGNELAPGLLAQFTRQFGQEAYDEATIEYYISRILRIRATFSDAETLIARSPFRRVERAGIDLLLFFSF